MLKRVHKYDSVFQLSWCQSQVSFSLAAAPRRGWSSAVSTCWWVKRHKTLWTVDVPTGTPGSWGTITSGPGHEPALPYPLPTTCRIHEYNPIALYVLEHKDLVQYLNASVFQALQRENHYSPPEIKGMLWFIAVMLDMIFENADFSRLLKRNTVHDRGIHGALSPRPNIWINFYVAGGIVMIW